MKKRTIVIKVAKLVFFNLLMFSTSIKAQVTNTGPYTTYGFSGGNMCETLPWQLVFHDEFNGSTIDVTKWNTYYPYGPNNTDNCLFCRTHTTTINSNLESQVFKDENVIVGNGTAKFILKKDNPTWMGAQRPFSSGMIYSKANVYAFQKGKFEIRCKLPSGLGLWPAFWLFGSGREIDVFEFRRGNTSNMEMSLHKWLPDNTTNTYSEPYNGIDYSIAFHTFALEWDKNVVTWYVDGVAVNRIFRLAFNTLGQRMNNCIFNNGYYTQYDWFPKDGQLYVIAGLGTEGGNNAPPATGSYPKQMEVDYIRVYQREPEQWFPPICSVRGNDVICTGQNSIFTLPEDFGSVSWSVSSNLDIISSSNSSITVRPKSFVINGDAWVKSDFSSQSICGTTSSTKNFWIGKPNDIAVVQHVYPCDQCFSIDAYCATTSKAVLSWNVGNGQYNNYDCAASPSFYIPYTVTATNVCGSQTASGSLVSPYCDGNIYRGSQGISVTPNPVSNILQITLNNILLDDIVQILIFNKNGTVVKRISNRFENTFDLDVTSYQNGVYNIIVNFKSKTPSISTSFTIQH